MEELERSHVDNKGRIVSMKANGYTTAEISDALGVSANTVSKLTSPQIAQALDYMEDPVNHPSHYTDGKYETIEFIERHGFSFHEGNAIKYISRAGKKDPNKMIEDLEKALWYIKRASNAEDYCPEAITAHDYILDKKLSPALASALALIEASEYEKAEGILEAEIKRLKKGKDEKITVKIQATIDPPYYFGKVVCTLSSDQNLLTPGKIYRVLGDRIMANDLTQIIFDSPAHSMDDIQSEFNGLHRHRLLASFVEFKGEA